MLTGIFIIFISEIFTFWLYIAIVRAPEIITITSPATVDISRIGLDNYHEAKFNIVQLVNNSNSVWLNGSFYCKGAGLPNASQFCNNVQFTYKGFNGTIPKALIPFSFNITIPIALLEKFNVTVGNGTEVWTVATQGNVLFWDFRSKQNTTFRFRDNGGAGNLMGWRNSNVTAAGGGQGHNPAFDGTTAFRSDTGGSAGLRCDFTENSSTNPVIKGMRCNATGGERITYFMGNWTEDFQTDFASWAVRSHGMLRLCDGVPNAVAVTVTSNITTLSWTGSYQNIDGSWLIHNATDCDMAYFQMEGAGAGLATITSRVAGDGTFAESSFGLNGANARSVPATAYPYISGFYAYPANSVNISLIMRDIIRQLDRDNTTLQFGNKSSIGGVNILSGDLVNISTDITTNRTSFHFNPSTFITRIRIGNFTTGATTALYVANTSSSTEPTLASNCLGRAVNESGTWNWYTACSGGTGSAMGTASNATGIEDYYGVDRSNNFALWLPIHNVSGTVSFLIDDTAPNAAPQWSSNSSSCGSSVVYTSTRNCTYFINITDPDDSGVPRTVDWVFVETNITQSRMSGGIWALENITNRANSSLPIRVYNGSACGSSLPNQALFCLNATNIAVNSSFYIRIGFNDTSNSINTTGLHIWTAVTAASPTGGMSFTLDNSAGDITKPFIGNDQTTTISSSETNAGDGGCTYTTFRNDTSTALTTFYEARGQIFYNFSTTGCGNYTAGTINRTATINSGNLSVPLGISPSGASQRLNGTIVWVFTGNDNATVINTTFLRTGADDITLILRRNTSENNHVTLFSSPNGTYNYTDYRANGTFTYSVNSTQTANYSAFLNSSVLAVLRGDRTIPVRVNNSLASAQVSDYINRSLPITINTTETYTGDDDANYFVWVNGTGNDTASQMGNISLTNFVNGSQNFTAYLGNSTWYIIINDTIRANWSAVNNFTTFRVLDTFTTYYEPKVAANFTTQATAWGFLNVLLNNTYSDIWLNVTVNFTSRNSSHFVNTTNFTQLNFTAGSWFAMASYSMSNNTNKTYVNNSNQTITFGAIGNTENTTFMVRSASNLNYSTYLNGTGAFYYFRHHNVSQSFWYHAKVNATQQFNPQNQFVRYRVCTGTPIARNPPDCTVWSNPVNVIQSAEGNNNVNGYRINFFTEGTSFLRTNYTINVSSTSDLLLFATIEGGTYFTPAQGGGGGGGGAISETGVKNISLKVTPSSKEFVILTSPEKPKPAVEKRTFNICNKELFTIQLQPEITGQYSDWVTKTTSPSGANVMILEPEACTNFDVEVTIPAVLKQQDYVIGIVLTDLLGQGKASLRLTVSTQPLLGIFQDSINWFISKLKWEMRFAPQQASVVSFADGGINIPAMQQFAIPWFGLIGGVSILTATFFIMRRLKQFQMGRFTSVVPLLFSVIFAIVWLAVLPA